VVLSLLILAQFALILHRADHADGPRETPCALCTAADHYSGMPAAESMPVFAHILAESVDLTGRPLNPGRFESAYFSRGPPPAF
jgi:hypothetical protein